MEVNVDFLPYMVNVTKGLLFVYSYVGFPLSKMRKECAKSHYLHVTFLEREIKCNLVDFIFNLV